MKTDARISVALNSMTKSLDQLSSAVTSLQTRLLSARKIHELQKLDRLLVNVVLDVKKFEIDLHASDEQARQRSIWFDYFAEIEKLPGSRRVSDVFNDVPVTWVDDEDCQAAQRARELGIETRVTQPDPILKEILEDVD